MASTEVRDAEEIIAPSATRINGKKRADPGKRQPPTAETAPDPESEPYVKDPDAYDGTAEPFIWLSGFTAADWQNNNMIGYLYRLAPVIDRKTNGKPTNLRKYGEFFDEDRVMRQFGSGTYRVDIVSKRAPRTKYIRLHSWYFSIMNLDYPPKVPPGDWVEDPENKIWEWAKGAIEENAAAAGAAVAGTPGGGDPNKIVGAYVDGMVRLNELVARNNPAPAPDNTMTLVMPLLLKLLDKPTGPDPMVSFLTQEMGELRKQNMEMLKELRENSKPKTLVDQIGELNLLNKYLKSGSSPKAKDWEDVAAGFIEQVGANLPAVASIFTKSNAAPAPSQQTQQPHTITHPQQEIPMEEQLTPPLTAERQKQILEKWQEKMQQVAMFMLDKFKNETGFDFRDWFISRYSRAVYDELRNDVSATELAQLVGTHEQLKTMMRPPIEVRDFFTDFFTEPGQEPKDRVTDEVKA